MKESIMAKFLVRWVGGDNIGIYDAESPNGAIFAAVKDVGYASIEEAADLICDEDGEMMIESIKVEE
jgi:hypothetical protein